VTHELGDNFFVSTTMDMKCLVHTTLIMKIIIVPANWLNEHKCRKFPPVSVPFRLLSDL
jgi:hypothetical protein